MGPRLIAIAMFLAGFAAAQDRVGVEKFTGCVLDSSGSPIPGAAVSFVDIQRLVTSEVLASPAARTGKDGRFRLSPAKGALYIAAKGRRAVVVRVFDSSKGCDLGEIVLYAGGTLIGTVVDDNGRPLAGVQVIASERRAPSGRRFANQTGVLSGARTNARGIFQLPCASASAIELQVSTPGYATATRFPVGAGSPLSVVLPKTGFVTGRVVDDKGQPRETDISIGYEAGASQTARSNSDGTFRLPILHRGRYRLGAAGWGLRWKSDVLDGPREDVVIAPKAKRGADGPITTAVRVEDATTGDPIRSFRA